MTAPMSPRPRILVVDDETGPRESLRMLLKPLYEIRMADSARVALEELADFHPDLVILDIKMPEMDGLEALRHIKHTDPAVEVIMITAYASLETVKQALSLGAFEYLIKPFVRHDLQDVVHRALKRRYASVGVRTEIASLVDQMRTLAARTRQLEEAARREQTEQSLRATQLSILRAIGRTVVAHLDLSRITATVVQQLRDGLGYDRVRIDLNTDGASIEGTDGRLVACPIRDAQGPLGHLVVDNRAAGPPLDARECELLEMLAEYLAVAVRNAHLYEDIATTRQRLEQVIACAGDAIIIVDADDRIQGWNPAAERILGRHDADAVGHPVTDFLPAADYAVGKRRLAAGAPTHVFDVSGPVVADRATELSITLSALRDGQRASDAVIAIVRDATAQRAMETQLRQSEKLTALGQLAGGSAHDFNNLLQAILGYTQLMKRNPTDTVIARSLPILEAAALDGAEAVRRIQQYAQLRRSETSIAVDLNEIVEDALKITRPRWEQTVSKDNRPLQLQRDLEAVPVISGRPGALTEALTNLILNAIDAMPDGGTLSISTGKAPGGHAVVTVADTGVGMTEAVSRRIFEPFFSTKGAGGSGLGLAMVYTIVQAHGGDIRVDSAPGHGAAFTLTFPPATPAPTTPTVAAPARARRHARVLVVDDDPGVLQTFKAILESFGHTTVATASGAAAVEIFARDDFDIVITDVGMPGMSGWQLAERLRAFRRSTAVIFVTGWGLRDDEVARLKTLGVTDCLFKPVQGHEVDTAIQTILSTN